MPFQVVLTKKHIIFGIYYNANHFREINCVILLGKYYIYTQTKNSRSVTIQGFMKILKNKLIIEECILKQNGKGHLFEKHWKKISDNIVM